MKVQADPAKHQVVFDQISKLGPGKEMILGIKVKVTGPAPKLATCKVVLTHDDLPDNFEDMAAVKVTTDRGAPPATAAAGDSAPK